MTSTNQQEQGLSGTDEKKRETLKRLGLGAAFVVPIVASFSLEGLTISRVNAAAPAGSGVHHQCPVRLPPKNEECDPECGCSSGLACVPGKGGGSFCSPVTPQ